MATTPPLSVLFLWHQHQPLYKDDLAQRYELPWVRLHATKDYVDMAALLDEFPAIKSNFNLVPSLLAQLDDYAQGKAQDKFIELTLKPAQDLSQDDQHFILQNFFMAHWEHMVDPYVRYRELLDKRGRAFTDESLARAHKFFTEQDWRDLQVWFNLTWFDPLWREKDAFIRGLFTKGKYFTEEEKQTLVAKQQELCQQVVAKHKELQERGQIEVTTTPFYHPILPLLCDTEAARMALPHVTLPQKRFKHPEDAREQVRRAIDDYHRRFGRAPQGMWPAEGSVSEEAAALFSDHGIRWVATDEAVLNHSLASPTFVREDLYEPYHLKIGEKSLHFFFRDHELSDAIGFVYASWDPETAADHFVKRLHDIHARLLVRDGKEPRAHVVSVILDGENCWEYYKDDGLPFLRALYKRLAADNTLQTVRASDYLDSVTQTKALPKLWSGSWINSNFAIWIGHTEDNAAWDLLARTRSFLQNKLETQPTDEKQSRQAWEEIYIAEGSDWCWWYGDDHSSANDSTFDYLFRKHLMNVYSIMGEKIPEDLHFPIKRKRTKALITAPNDFITPLLDGRVTNYFEWHSAGMYKTEAGGTGTMHKSENFIKDIYFGFNEQNLYFRFDPNRPLTPESISGITIQFAFTKPETREFLAAFGAKGTLVWVAPQDNQLPPGAYEKIIELVIPLSAFHNPEKQPFELSMIILKDGLEQERWPADTTLPIPYPSTDAFVENWII